MAKLRMDLIVLEELLFGAGAGEININSISLDDEDDIVTFQISGSRVPEVKEVIGVIETNKHHKMTLESAI